MFRNLHEVITDKIQQCHLMMQEQCKGFADNHDTVHAKLERHQSTPRLSNWNPGQVVVWEQTPVNKLAGGSEHHLRSQDTSQESRLSFDYNQESSPVRYRFWIQIW